MSNYRLGYESIPEEFKEYILFNSGVYTVRNDRNSIFINFGRYSSKDVACAATKLLIKHDWNIRDLGSDLVSEYLGTFYVFKEINNNLIFDSKFASYEEAVEYSEINFRCNDYHNDIFRIQSKKKGYKDQYNSSKTESSSDVIDRHIFEENNKFIVKKSKNKNSFIYGRFDSRDVACAASKILIDFNWKLNNQYELSFYDDAYWVFEVYENKLLFKGKSESYEDALDIITPSKAVVDKRYLDSISENHERIMKRKNGIKNESKSKGNLKFKNNVDVNRIWKSPYIKKVQKDIPQRIFVQNCSKNGNKLFVLDFNYNMGKIKCVVTGVDIKSQKRHAIDAKDFPEFKLIIGILETNGWDISKIKDSSSIYFYNKTYYKIQVIKDNTFVFSTLSSYNLAERTHLNCRRIRKIPFNNKCPSDIDKLGDYYELVKFKKGKVYRVNGLKSLEKIKAIRDILIHSNWDFDIFYKYDLFYLNGIYWELTRKDNIVYLIDKFESIAL